MKPTRLLFAFAPIAVFALAACQQQQTETPAEQNPEAKPGLSASDGVLVLPAVKGNPAAAYLSLANNSDQAVTVAGASVDAGNSAEIHETRDGKMASVDHVELEPGTTVKFERGGLHIMVFGLRPEVAAGNTAEVTLTFSDGDKISVPLKVEAAGAAASHNGADH